MLGIRDSSSGCRIWGHYLYKCVGRMETGVKSISEVYVASGDMIFVSRVTLDYSGTIEDMSLWQAILLMIDIIILYVDNVDE